jgi:hypothetical protein
MSQKGKAEVVLQMAKRRVCVGIGRYLSRLLTSSLPSSGH